MAYSAYQTPPFPETGVVLDEWDVTEWTRIYDFTAEEISDSDGQIVLYFSDRPDATLTDVLEELSRGFTPEKLYEAFRLAFQNVQGTTLPAWENMKKLMEYQKKVKQFHHLFRFINDPDALRKDLEALVELLLIAHPHLSPNRAKEMIAAITLGKLQDELQLAREDPDPEIFWAYETHLDSGGPTFASWLMDWSGSRTLRDDLYQYRAGKWPEIIPTN